MKPSKNHKWSVGDLARNVESGWLGRIVAIHEPRRVWIDRVGGASFAEVMADMVGVDELCLIVAGASVEDSICNDDTQQHAVDDLRFVEF